MICLSEVCVLKYCDTASSDVTESANCEKKRVAIVSVIPSASIALLVCYSKRRLFFVWTFFCILLLEGFQDLYRFCRIAFCVRFHDLQISKQKSLYDTPDCMTIRLLRACKFPYEHRLWSAEDSTGKAKTSPCAPRVLWSLTTILPLPHPTASYAYLHSPLWVDKVWLHVGILLPRSSRSAAFESSAFRAVSCIMLTQHLLKFPSSRKSFIASSQSGGDILETAH